MRLLTLSLPLLLTGFLTAAEVHFGPTAISSIETARLSAYCDGSVVPGPCLVTFEFRKPDGTTLLTNTQTIQPGAGAFLDLPADRAGITRGHGEIDPCWDVQRGGVFLSLEVFHSGNLRTRMSIGWSDRSLPRSGDIDFAPAGLTSSDTARLGAFCPDDTRGAPACRVHLEFHDLNGRTLKQADLTVQPGGSGFLDFRFSEAASSARRLMLQPCIKVGDGGPVVATLGIIDDGGGQPAVQTYPALLAQ
jgi:hypothetical protein